MRDRVATQESLRRSEEMLQHSQKMEAVGRLAGGVAHDFNNLLTAIIGYAGLLMQRLDRDSTPHQDAHLILQAGERAAGLTRQLLVFSRKQLLQPKVVDLSQLVGNLHKMLQRIIGEHIVMRVDVVPDGARVRADPGQIEQVIVNLGVNARDAMPRGGQLTIRTRLLSLDAANPSQLPAGEYVALEVSDTGTGMDETTQRQIFEPFFTTKGPGKGRASASRRSMASSSKAGAGSSSKACSERAAPFAFCWPRKPHRSMSRKPHPSPRRPRHPKSAF